MEGLLSVSVGTVFWASVSFIIVLLLLKKMAWGPIVASLKEREEGIANALNEAERARAEMVKLQAGNEDLLRQARDERDQILKDAKLVAEKIRSEASAKTQAETDRMITAARAEIENQKKAAIAELKNSVATLSIDIAEKLVREKLTDAEKQKALNQSMAADISAN
ncbi:MAG: F0F1 ATP synthase subunit B [Flavobacteriales bacterium]|jgi:F-type H+-transporting ATPase subunit b